MLPLAIATGAGAGAQHAIGTGVFGGMVAGTFLGIFFIPVFFVVVQRLSSSAARCRSRPRAPAPRPQRRVAPGAVRRAIRGEPHPAASPRLELGGGRTS